MVVSVYIKLCKNKLNDIKIYCETKILFEIKRNVER